MLTKAIADLKQGLGLYYVWSYQAYHEITVKYKRTVLGSLWLSGGMLVTSFSLAFLFGALFHQPIKQSLPYVMGGIIAFMLIAYVFFEGVEMFMSSSGLIKNHAYPFTFYTFLTVCRSFLLFLHNLVIYWIVMVLFQAAVIPHWSIIAALPVALVFIFTWGTLAAMFASRFRDMRFMLPYLGQLFSYLTPIFWRPDGLPANLMMIVTLSPIYDLIEIIRAPLLGKPAPILLWELALGYTALGVVLWLICFSVFRRRIAFWV